MILLLAGALSYNQTLYDVAQTRQLNNFAISEQTKIEEYDCLIGVPYGYKFLIDKEVYFIKGDEIVGPWLVVDVEAKKHHPHMVENNLMADTNCLDYVHLKGQLGIVIEQRRY